MVFAMSGKQLISDSIWQPAAIGTADPGAGGCTGGVNGGGSTDAVSAQRNTHREGTSNDVDGNSCGVMCTTKCARPTAPARRQVVATRV